MKLKDIIKNNPFTILFVLFATVVSGITFVFSRTAAVAELAVILLFAVFGVFWLSNSVERKKERLQLLNKAFIQSGEETGRLMAFPLAAVLVRENGEIDWFNEEFNNVIEAFPDFSCGDIREIIPDAAGLFASDVFAPVELVGQKKKFTVYCSKVSDGLYSLYFVDDTALKDIRNEYNLSRPSVLLINADSLEQTEDTFSHADYYTLISEIEKLITQWLVSYNCVFRKFSDGKFIALTENRNLNGMILKKFDILDRVREYRFGEQDAEITLSIGVGNGASFAESEAAARQALDMARGRGGDQVAVKMKENYEFFGGITNRKEKRGKIKSRIMASALTEYMESCSAVYISGHAFSDFDCIGAAVGVAALARASRKPAYIIVNRKTTLAAPLIGMLENAGWGIEFISPEKAQETAHDDALFVITDTMREDLVEAKELLKKNCRTVVIDHHRMSVSHIANAALTFHEPYASSACEMVTELVQYCPMEVKLQPVEAQALLAGILLDTKNFSLRVGVRTFEAAAFLKDKKADTVEVRKLFAGTAEENANVSRIINNAKFYKNYAVAKADFTHPELRLLCSKAADAMLDIENVDASFVLSEAGGGIACSARSLGKVGVHLIMEEFGGGGHQSMAACRMADCSMEEAEKKLMAAIKAYFDKNE